MPMSTTQSLPDVADGLKRCSKCKAVYPLTDFYADRRSADRKNSWCRYCQIANVRRWQKDNKRRAREYRKAWYAKNRLRVQAAIKAWAQQHPLAALARHLVARAVQIGLLVMPDTCDACGQASEALQCHHPDYHRPLWVYTLCISCHRAAHGIQWAEPLDADQARGGALRTTPIERSQNDGQQP